MSPCIYVFISVSNCECVFSRVCRRGCMRPHKKARTSCTKCVAVLPLCCSSTVEEVQLRKEIFLPRVFISLPFPLVAPISLSGGSKFA